MTGASARRKGADNERDFVKWLRANGYPNARRYLAGDGRQPGDIDGVAGVSLEVRAREVCKPGSWLDGAEQAAGGRLAVVIYHPPGVADPGDWAAIVRVRQLIVPQVLSTVLGRAPALPKGEPFTPGARSPQ